MSEKVSAETHRPSLGLINSRGGTQSVALDVYVEVDQNPRLILAGLPRLAFDDDNEGYFWFLYSSFEHLATITGQMIDLYGLVTFAGDLLPPLKAMLAEAQQIVATQPDTWEVLVGWSGEQVEANAIYKMVRRTDLGQILTDLQRMTEAAIAGQGQVVFYGD